jgi:hypothetical protein
MSLDFVFANSNSDVSSSKIIFAMDESLHTLIFSLATPQKNYPTIYRMEDFYADNKFDHGSLQRLEAELKTIIKMGAGDRLDGLLDFVRKAVVKGGSVYLLAD